jgi:hypothetical protein
MRERRGSAGVATCVLDSPLLDQAATFFRVAGNLPFANDKKWPISDARASHPNDHCALIANIRCVHSSAAHAVAPDLIRLGVHAS